VKVYLARRKQLFFLYVNLQQCTCDRFLHVSRTYPFWAFPVYNYHTKSIQVLEIKQQTIMRALEAFVNNPKWGNPQRYDLMIEKVKTGHRDWDVEYHVIPEPPSPIDPGIAELATQVPVRLEALYDGGDPFAETDEAGEQASPRQDILIVSQPLLSHEFLGHQVD
jgi:hypothetical protein